MKTALRKWAPQSRRPRRAAGIYGSAGLARLDAVGRVILAATVGFALAGTLCDDLTGVILKAGIEAALAVRRICRKGRQAATIVGFAKITFDEPPPLLMLRF